MRGRSASYRLELREQRILRINPRIRKPLTARVLNGIPERNRPAMLDQRDNAHQAHRDHIPNRPGVLVSEECTQSRRCGIDRLVDRVRSRPIEPPKQIGDAVKAREDLLIETGCLHPDQLATLALDRHHQINKPDHLEFAEPLKLRQASASNRAPSNPTTTI